MARRADQVLREPGLPGARNAYVAQLGLSQAALMDRLRSRLTSVIGAADYAVACTLLLHEGLEDAAWGWLRGEEPAAALRDRGLSTPVTGELSDLGVVARLYAGQDFRLVLVIDELASSTSWRSPRLAAAPTRRGKDPHGELRCRYRPAVHRGKPRGALAATPSPGVHRRMCCRRVGLTSSGVSSLHP